MNKLLETSLVFAVFDAFGLFLPIVHRLSWDRVMYIGRVCIDMLYVLMETRNRCQCLPLLLSLLLETGSLPALETHLF